MDDEATTMSIHHFFGWFRERHSSIERLSRLTMPPGMEEVPLNILPDQAILVSAGIDSLATHWKRLYQLSIQNASQRMGEFLIKYSRSEIWRRYSLPDLLRRARMHDNYRPLETSLKAIQLHLPIGRVRYWHHDPEGEVLLNDDPDLNSSALHVQWKKGKSGQPDETLESWLRRSRYGELFYSKYRCPWIHESKSDKDISADSFLDVNVPHYDNSKGRPRRLVFPLAFMLRTYAEVIGQFENACEASMLNPIPPD
jgi:hypothetical protein